MREVAILGVGELPVSEHWNRSLADLAGQAALEAMRDAGADRIDSLILGNMLAATGTGGQLNVAAEFAD